MLKFNQPNDSKLLIIILLFYLVWGALSLYQNKPKIDEAKNHLPVLLGMYEQGYLNYIFSDNYAAANTPLPYILVSIVHKVYNVFKVHKVEPSLLGARVCNFVFSLLTGLLFISIYKKLNDNKVDYSILLFLFYPYFLKTSFTFYMALYGVLFLLLAVYLLQNEFKYCALFGGMAASAGILSQQFIAAVPFAYLVAKWSEMKNVKRKMVEVRSKTREVRSQSRFKEYVLFFIPLIFPAALFILWGGLSHPKWQMHNPGFDMTHITAVFTITGGVLFPYVMEKIRWDKSLLIIGAAALVLTYLFSPGHASKGDYGVVTGYTFHFLEIVKDISPVLSFVIQSLLCTAGMYVFYILGKELKCDTEKLLYYTAVILVIIFAFNTVFSERHLLPMTACLLLLALPRLKKLWIKRMWISYQVVFGSVYFYYWMFGTANF